MIHFKYNGKIYSTSNLQKDLKKMNITESDIKFINKSILLGTQYKINPNTFFNPNTGSKFICFESEIPNWVPDKNNYSRIYD